MTDEEREKLMDQGLEEKIAYSKNIIKEAIERFNNQRLAIAITGGKDSTTMLSFFKNVCHELSLPIPKCMFIDEGDVFPEIYDFVQKLKREWELDITIVKNTDVSSKVRKVGDIIRVKALNERNKEELKNINFDGDEFIFEPESYIGNHLMKTVPMKVFIEESKVKALATAIRWDEQDARKKEVYFSPRSNPDHIRVHPILHFKERDIWNTIHKYKIPFCELYRKGYRSLGARGTTYKVSDIPAWEQDLENTTERGGRRQDKEEMMARLRGLGYM